MLFGSVVICSVLLWYACVGVCLFGRVCVVGCYVVLVGVVLVAFVLCCVRVWYVVGL